MSERGYLHGYLRGYLRHDTAVQLARAILG